MNKPSWTIPAALLLAGSLLLSACGSGAATKGMEKEGPGGAAAPAAQTQKLVMASWSKPIAEQTNLYQAEAQGWFKEKGIDFTFVPGAGGGDAIKNILTKQADIAFTDPGSLYFALEKGEKLRVIYNIYPQNVFNVVSLKEKGIREPKDLKGKKIGVYSLASGTRHNLLVLLHQAGLSEKDVTIIETGVSNFAPLIQGQVDATAATDTGLADAKLKGLGEVNELRVADSLNVPSDVFVVTEETLTQKKELLKSFLAVYKRSAQWMIDKPEEAAAVAVAKAIDGQDKARNREVIKLRNASALTPGGQPLGTLDAALLQQGADLYKRLGLIQKDLSLKDIVTNELLPIEEGAKK
ncbi:NitT/TauT family transport system substrate-binding protein [Paenibacillus sp. UNCCL117]|uniref:ABC transporter substrate-binding protein n=1 Tax=unclassified Paenibacillus TaxID=185978 RepID=UPI00087E07E9|nr:MULTISPECIES: ABC transporter substrate-binding protein [unclassified Paenibacillus]SDD02012.1 NitT/TauT family transport system substrate-binding protein [Paenibacillus sp. cl123]SFW32573.1 NitT/TauT family transport system substrate-binding protein [Paenibacillus sp. UNCCL117]